MKATLRTLLNRPSFSATVVVTLGLGLGLATAILSLLYEIYLKPLPYPEADRLGVLFSTYPERGWDRASASIPEVRDVAERSVLFESTSAFAAFRDLSLTGDGPAEVVETNFSDAAHLAALGARPLIGRLFTEEETRRGSGARVVILAHRFWHDRLGARADVLGTTLQLNGRDFTVIGVLPEDFRDVGEVWERTDVFLPLAMGPLAYHPGMFETRSGREFYGLLQLRPGASHAQAQRELDRIAAELATEHPASHEGRGLQFIPLRELFYGDIRALALALGAGALFVLLITCVNLAHLFLVQGESRRDEMAVRAALGASRAGLVRQRLAEVALLSSLGGAGGIAIGAALVRVFNREGVLRMPSFTVIAVNAWAILGVLLLLVACALAFGVLPAWRASRVDLRAALQNGALRVTGGRHAGRRRNLLIATEVALAAAVLVAAALTAISLRTLQRTPTGYDPERLLTASFELDRSRYPDPGEFGASLRRLHAEIAAAPGVDGATLWGLRMLGRATYNVLTTPGNLDHADPRHHHMTRRLQVMPDAFQMLGIPLLAGATFNPSLTPDSEPYEIVIGENYARRFWPDRPLNEIVGETVHVHASPLRSARIVGIAADVKHNGRAYDESQLIGDIYLSQHQWPAASQAVLLRYRGEVGAVQDALRGALARFDPTVALTDVVTMTDRLEREQGVQELTASLFAIYALLASLLSALGVYGVLAFAVSQRTREFGVRLGVGARPTQLLARLLREGVVWIGAGVAAGLVLAYRATPLLQDLLAPDVSTSDYRVFLAVGVGLLLLGLVACLIPAWRACRTDPLTALRNP